MIWRYKSIFDWTSFLQICFLMGKTYKNDKCSREDKHCKENKKQSLTNSNFILFVQFSLC